MTTPRRLLPAAALVPLVLATACAGGPDAQGGDALKIASVATDRAPIEAVIEKFQEDNPDVEIETTFADTDQYQATLRTQLSSGTAPDVFFAWPGNGNPGAIEAIAPADYLADLSEHEWATDIPESFRPVTQVDGTPYILPMTASAIGAMYNVEAMEAIGAEPPATWSELLDLCSAAQEDGRVAFAAGLQTDWVTQLVNYALVATLVYGETPDFHEQMAEGDATFADSEWRTAMEMYTEMDEEGCFNDDPVGTSYENSLQQVADGDAVAVVQVTTSLNQLRSEAGDTEFDMFALPATDSPEETLMPGAAGGAYGINADTGNPDLAAEFLDFMAEPENVALYAEEAGALPGIPTDIYELDPALETADEFQQSGRTVPFMDQRWPNAEVQSAHFTGVQEVFSDQAGIDDALAAMDEAYQEE
ncbi:raffinose/stachyose/melibiose transport system substrate-binding protein [Lipingzhangella halophila]|uniref:Raffinose/stachyose/melibiose transport system substrate-binding protein n=1 Tax=Lipingzhangella halophila TaxID=1783352 RepID=A0A7W7RMS2_9ACTN|nr:extracellular solute-binding protein [Lipingzhangella halophila]MBB4934854.1 raffinose/stachyose/melibiose transport system substrate-binding protein [Lipingzhangella halophila]